MTWWTESNPSFGVCGVEAGSHPGSSPMLTESRCRLSRFFSQPGLSHPLWLIRSLNSPPLLPFGPLDSTSPVNAIIFIPHAIDPLPGFGLYFACVARRMVKLAFSLHRFDFSAFLWLFFLSLKIRCISMSDASNSICRAMPSDREALCKDCLEGS